jgi:two-component system, cell cycle sensor histidine kinase and response regulator CckA
VSARPVETPQPLNLQGKETVLLVEDEDLVRCVARRILEKFSYRVLGAESGATALRLGQQHREPIHLLLTDVVMPGMSGKDLAECWRQQHPETSVLYTSGYTENAIVHQGSLERDTHFIQKPCRPELLARKIREVLDGSASLHKLQYWGEL